MDPKSPKLLEDMRDAAVFVLDVTQGKRLDDYRADRLLRQAVERNFEIIGEAVSRLAKVDPVIASQITGYRRIIAFRNVLSHGYDVVDEAQVWEVIQTFLPELLRDVTKLQTIDPR